MSFGGTGVEGPGSHAKSTSTNTSNQTDRRQVVDNGGIGVAGEGAVINLLDAGAIKSAFEFAKASDQETSNNLSETLGFARSIFSSGLGVLGAAGKQVEAQTALVAKAYDDSKGAGDQKTLLTAAAIATVAIVAIRVWGR